MGYLFGVFGGGGDRGGGGGGGRGGGAQEKLGMAGYKSVNEWKKRNMSETFGAGYVV